ncbi:MAG: hypothetical protein Q7O12_00680 [Deltaproteobacteria bacterium]|nr:hypothetical protein [Deltaproteobacteria bacterium]
MANGTDKLGPKDFITGCLVIVVAIVVVPLLVLLFKVSVYLAVIIGVIVAVILGIALLGKVVRLIFFRGGSDDKHKNNYLE